mgnify:CR=1 FL=1
MTVIGILANGRMAQAFVDYMMGQGVTCRLSQNEQDDFVISTNEITKLSYTQQQFQEFLQNPQDNKYLAASWHSANPQISTTNNHHANLSLVTDFIMHAGPVTLAIFFICVFVYLTKLINVVSLYNLFSFFNPLILDNISHIWRLFTPALLHFSALHIIFNLLWWWYLGGQIEQKLSSTKLVVLFVLASSLPNLLQYFMTGPAFGGLSGVVYALVGYFWILGRYKPQSGLFLPPPYIAFMLLWLVAGFFDLLGVPVANGAHLGGLLVGCGLAWIDSKQPS